MVRHAAARRRAEAELAAARVPAGPIYTPQEALDDPHVKAADFFQRIEYPGMASRHPMLDQPVKLSRTPLEISRRPPTLGEHTDEILAELGYEAAAIAELRARRRVAQGYPYGYHLTLRSARRARLEGWATRLTVAHPSRRGRFATAPQRLCHGSSDLPWLLVLRMALRMVRSL